MEKLRWGIVSTGRISDWFCGDFHQVEDGELLAVSSRNQENARKFANRYDIPNAYGDFEQMLANPDIDIIYIGTPHTMHVEQAAKSLRAGKSVLCEKPIAINAKECATLINVANETGGYLLEAIWTYFLPAMQTAKAWVDDGRIGKLIRIHVDFGYPVKFDPNLREYDVNLAGGCLLEMGVYPIAIASFFAEGEPKVLSARGRRAANGVEDDVTALLEFENVIASIGTSYRARLPNAAHIVGSDGYIAIPDAFRATECALYQLDQQVDHFSAPRDTRGYEYQAIALCKDLREGRNQSLIAPLDQSLKFQRAIDEIRSQI